LARDHAVTCAHVRAHTGDALNELADSMAKMGLRAARATVDREEARREAARLAAVWSSRRLRDDTARGRT
jgi:ribonuclease HI